jgi:hypothetical protein
VILAIAFLKLHVSDCFFISHDFTQQFKKFVVDMNMEHFQCHNIWKPPTVLVLRYKAIYYFRQRLSKQKTRILFICSHTQISRTPPPPQRIYFRWVGVAKSVTRLWDGRVWLESRLGQWRNIWVPASLLFSTYLQLFLRGWSGWGVKLTSHFQLVPGLRMLGAVPPFTQMFSWRGA